MIDIMVFIRIPHTDRAIAVYGTEIFPIPRTVIVALLIHLRIRGRQYQTYDSSTILQIKLFSAVLRENNLLNNECRNDYKG